MTIEKIIEQITHLDELRKQREVCFQRLNENCRQKMVLIHDINKINSLIYEATCKEQPK